MRQIIILLALMLLFPAAAFAWDDGWEGGYDFEVDSIYYEIISESPPKVRVCSKTWWKDAYEVMRLSSDYSGNLVIPNEVSYEDKTYAVTGIYWNAFFECGNLESITIPTSVSNITITEYKATYIPNGKTGIKNITVAEGNTVFDSRNECNAVIMTATNRLVAGCDNTIIPNSVTSIGTSAFVGCKGLIDVHISSTITRIGKSAFAGCSNMINIELSNSTTVEDYALANTGLTDIVWPNSMQSISEGAFQECSNFVNINVPAHITEIENSVFRGCTNLATITSMALTPPRIENQTFDNYNATLYVPRESYNSYKTATGWKNFNMIFFIEPYYEDNGIFYSITSDSTVCVTFKDDSYNSYSGDVVIPESINYDGKDYIVNAIDEKAFYNCSGLTSVIIPNTITTIGNYAFYGCSGLTSLTIGKSVASIGYNAFITCYNLKELTWNAIDCSSNDYMPKSNIESVTIGSEVEVLPNYFVSGSKITAVEIPNSVKYIGRNAFSDCNGLTSIEIPNSVTAIGIRAFNGCSELISVIISNSVISIGDNVFENCYSLSNIVIPNSVSSIGNYAFRYCYNLKSVTIPNSVSSIGKYAFYDCSRMMSLDIPSSVTTIGSDAFLNCNALSKVTVSDVSSWCKITFSDYYSNPLYYSHHLYLNNQEIKHLVIPDDVTAINNYAFVNGTSFLDLTLPATLESIGNYAFEGCKRLTDITLGSSMNCIGSGAFKDCTAISSVTCMAPTPPTMAAFNCFDSDCYDWATLYVPGDRVEVYNSTLYWNKFANTVGTGIEVDGIYYLFNLDTSEATVTYKDQTYCTYSGEVVIPENVNYGDTIFTVTGIGEAAFAYCDELTSVTMPNTVASIGDYAFMYCENLPSIDIPNAVTSIGDNAFDGCSSFSKIEIPNSVLTIGDMAFQGCTNVTDLIIGSGVTQIGAKAFNYCNALNTVTCKGNTPPTMDNSNCFTSYGYQAKLLVPHAFIEDYQSSNYWYKFAVIEGFNLSEPGDVNGDGDINISDVTSLINLLLTGGEIPVGSDVNGDGQVNISDVTALINRLLSGN